MRHKYTVLIIAVVLLAALAIIPSDLLSEKNTAEPESIETPAPEEETTAVPEPEITPEPEIVIPDSWQEVSISELMYDNKTTVRDEDGQFSDWIELYNGSDESITLDGWLLSDRDAGSGIALDGITLEAGEYRVIFCRSGRTEGFGISENETVSLYYPGGGLADSAEALSARADASTVHSKTDGTTAVCLRPTPGFPDGDDGFTAYQATLTMPDGLVINEVCTANTSSNYKYNNKYYDWVELCNNSDETIQLSDYYLSDELGDICKWQFPEAEIAPHAFISVLCMGDDAPDTSGALSKGVYAADFSLNHSGEQVYLSTKTEPALDYVGVYGIRADMTYGRDINGAGWLIYTKATPKAENSTDGYYFISEKPQASITAGVYDDVDELVIELSGDGDIYYTINGDRPTVSSTLYTGPITITSTSVIKAIAVREGRIESEVMNESYIVNEYLTLPVISITSDYRGTFNNMYYNARSGNRMTNVTTVGNITYFVDNEVAFSSDCGINMKGYTSLNSPQKNLGVSFKGIYDSEEINYDIFGNGVTSYTKLSIRAGQDAPLGVIRNELGQELCRDYSDSVIIQHGQYCILFVNGEYFGLYCLKEDAGREFASQFFGVEKDDVEVLHSPMSRYSDFYAEVFQYISDNDVTDPEWYASFCERVDIDSLIDWVIIEAYTANSDINGNLKYARAADGKWYFMLYDLDWTFKLTEMSFYNIMGKDINAQWRPYLIRLCKNEEFRDKLLSRYAELMTGALSDENVLNKIDEMCDYIQPEIARTFSRWYGKYSTWERQVDVIRNFVSCDGGHAQRTARHLCYILGISDEERMEYFGF